MINPAKRTILGILLLLTIAGCSTVRTGYFFLDWWIGWAVNDYLSIDKQQKQKLNIALDNFHLWHQNTQLPTYAGLVDDVLVIIEQPETNPSELQTILNRGQQFWRTSVDQLLPDLEVLLKSLSDDQWQTFAERVDKKNLKYAQKYVQIDIEKRVLERRESVEKYVKKWIGNITPAQRQIIQHWNQQLQPLADYSLEERKQWFGHLNNLRNDWLTTDYSNHQQRFEQLFLDPYELTAEPYRQAQNENQRLSLIMVSEIHSSLSDKQKAKLIKKLTGYRDDFRHLAQQAQNDTEAASPTSEVNR